MYRIPDRFRFFSALAATAALPESPRIAARMRLLSRLYAAQARRADVVVICHPKSGGTWFRVMLSRLYHVKYNLPPRRIVKSDEFHNVNPDMPRFVFTNGHYAYESAVQAVLDDMQSRPDGIPKKVILLARNPCDIAVSWYLQFTKRTKPFKRELISHSLRDPIDREKVSMWDFAMHEELGLPALIEFHNMWERRLSGTDWGLVVRYEDLRQAPVESMRRVVSLIGAPFTDDEIRHAVEFASFDNLRELEQSGYFHNSSMALRNAKDPDTLKVRKGKVGGFRTYFTPDQVAVMEDMVRERLAPGLGYDGAPAAAAPAASHG